MGEPRSNLAGEATLRTTVEQSPDNPDSLLQMALSPTTRHVAYFLFPHRIQVYDFGLHQVSTLPFRQAVAAYTDSRELQLIGTTTFERTRSPLRRIIISPTGPMRIFCLHVDGSYVFISTVVSHLPLLKCLLYPTFLQAECV